MSVIILPQRFKQQPQYPAPIDRSGMGARARFVLIGSQPKELITGTQRGGTIGSSSATAGGIGYVLPTSITTWTTQITDLDPNISGSFSVFWRGVLRDNTAQRLFRSATSGNTNGWSFGTEVSPVGTVKFNFFGVWSSALIRSGDIPIVDNSIHSAAVVYDAVSKSVEFFFDGVSESTSTWNHDPFSQGDSQTFSMYSATTKAFKPLTVQAYVGKSNRAEIRSLHENPWQIFKAPPRRLWVASAAATEHNLTGGDATQANAASTASISQAHALDVQTSAQANAAGIGAISQQHVLAGAASSQANTGDAAAITQAHALTADGVTQGNTSSTGAITQGAQFVGAPASQTNSAGTGTITQAHVLSGANSAQANAASNSAVIQVHALSASTSTQPNTGSTGAVTLGVVHDLTASITSQANTGAAGAISQAHILVCPASVQDSVAAASAVVQAHLLIAAHGAQANAASSGAIEQSSGIPPVDGPVGSGPRLRIPQGHRPAMRNTSRPRQLR